MRVLGAVVAGGLSRRFGSDKALVMLNGGTLIEHALKALRAQTEGVVVCGREWPSAISLADRPASGQGPLGGLNAALHHARQTGFDAVLCVPVDVFPLPPNLRILLQGCGPKVFDGQHLIGFWQTQYADALAAHLARGDRSCKSWIQASSATRVSDASLRFRNLNRPSDLPRIESLSGADILLPCEGG